MAYTYNFVFDFGSLTGLTLNGKLYDHTGAQVGATIISGFVEIGNGVYTYLHSALPDGGRGVLVAYKSTDPTIKVPCEYNPQTTENADIKTSAIQTLINALNNLCGDGTFEFTYTLTSTATGQPLPGARVRITTDMAGWNTVWTGTTDVLGVARNLCNDKPRLRAGVYYFWRTGLSTFTFSNPDTETVG